jgi:uncharacterized protein YcfJ
MKKLSILSLMLIANMAYAVEDTATIKRVEPQYTTVNTPIEVCRDETVKETIQPKAQPEKSYGGAILGGLAGGILGNQVGGGSGRAIATAAGVAAGAYIGDNMSNNAANANGNIQYQPQTVSRQVRNCRMENESRQEITGYRIDYIYAGKPYSVVSDEKPVGSKLRVHVEVHPIL